MHMYRIAPNFHATIFLWILWLDVQSRKFFSWKFRTVCSSAVGVGWSREIKKILSQKLTFAWFSMFSRNFWTTKIWSHMICPTSTAVYVDDTSPWNRYCEFESYIATASTQKWRIYRRPFWIKKHYRTSWFLHLHVLSDKVHKDLKSLLHTHIRTGTCTCTYVVPNSMLFDQSAVIILHIGHRMKILPYSIAIHTVLIHCHYNKNRCILYSNCM